MTGPEDTRPVPEEEPVTPPTADEEPVTPPAADDEEPVTRPLPEDDPLAALRPAETPLTVPSSSENGIAEQTPDQPLTAEAPAPDPLPATSTAASAATSAAATRRPPRMRTVAFGFVLAVVACSVLAARFSGVHVDGGTLLVITLVGAGVLMVIGAVTAPVRHRR